MSSFQEPQATVLDVRNIGPHQLDLEPVTVVGTAKQHGLTPQQDARLPGLQHALHDVVGLLSVILHGNEPRPRAAVARGNQRLAVLAIGSCDQRIGRIEQWLAGAVIALERDHLRRRLASIRELQDVLRPMPRGRNRSPAHRRRPRSMPAPPGFSASTMSACSRLTSWYSSTST